VEATASLRHTPLIDAHRAAGAKLVPFAGWEMPVQYEGVRQEHLAVRSGCGVFDVSHMGEIETAGRDAGAFLQQLLSNDVSKIELRGAQYSCLCREDGGVLDDLFTYHLAENRYLTVTNAANHESDLDWWRKQAEAFDGEVEVHDEADSYAMLAVQGPKAREIVGAMAQGELPPRFHTADLNLSVGDALVCGTGYTGEDGVEILIDPDEAMALWESLLDGGAVPAGLAARDTLRLEVCYCLYGNELSVERTPIEAGLGWCCKDETGFTGSEEIARRRADGPAEKLIAFALTDRGVPRQGNAVLSDGEAVGEVTSGTHSPSLEKGVGMAYVSGEAAEPGTGIEIDVRGKRRDAQVEAAPLYKDGI
jgi:glycine cleavage system T protein (aminomethyltransferase)